MRRQVVIFFLIPAPQPAMLRHVPTQSGVGRTPLREKAKGATMNFTINYIDEIAAAGHRRELEEQARIERLLAEAYTYSHPATKRFSLMRLLHLRQREQPTDNDVRNN
jgi:hypothetical protein